MKTTNYAQLGFMMLEALVAMVLLMIAASGTLWFLHRALRGASLQRSHLEPNCEQPECVSSPTFSECRCGSQIFRTQR
jgi:hypothetical protein